MVYEGRHRLLGGHYCERYIKVAYNDENFCVWTPQEDKLKIIVSGAGNDLVCYPERPKESTINEEEVLGTLSYDICFSREVHFNNEIRKHSRLILI